MTRFETYPISLSQYNIWTLECLHPDTTINHINTTIKIQGRIDFVAMKKSLLQIIANDPSLRTRITMDGEKPVQYRVPFLEESFPVFDFSQTDPDGVEYWEQMLAREPMLFLDAPLYRFILFRTGERSGGIYIKVHHIISDGWTQSQLCSRIARKYTEILAGGGTAPEELPSYERHVLQEKKYAESPAYKADRDFWKATLQKAGEPSAIKAVKSAAVSPVGRRLSFSLPQMLNFNIQAFCNKNHMSPFLVMYMALAVYFKRVGGSDQFTIGAPIYNRSTMTDKKTPGMFVSTLPFSSNLKEEWSFSNFASRVGEQWLELLRHSRFPYKDIQQMADEASSEPGRLFHIALSYLDCRVFDKQNEAMSFEGKWHYSGYQSEQLCIHLSNREGANHLSIDYDFLTQFFSEAEIEAFHMCLMNILRDALSAPERPINRLSLLSSAERERVLYTFNETEEPIYQSDLWELFEDAVEQYPSRAVLVQEGRRISYSKLAANACRVCAAVKDVCDEPNALVAVFLKRDSNLFTSMIGILRAGCAFVIITTDQPVRRIEEIIALSGASTLISTQEEISRVGLEGIAVPIIDCEQLWEQSEPEYEPPEQTTPDDLAYVVYTSGSTGVPKGVEVTRRGLLNFILAMGPVFGDGGVLSTCSVGFDAFMIESVVAMMNGKTIIVPRDEELESPRALANLIKSFKVGFFSMTPSRLAAFMTEPEFVSAMSLMEVIICGGEAFSSDLLQNLLKCTRANIYNQYGPSEATVGVSLQLLNKSRGITAGKPMQNCRLYVLDNWMNPLPVGVYGNLYIGGLCLGRGYRNSPEQTAENFSENPFELGDRLYRTGDIARWTQNGEIQLAGRADSQVKLRGLRVELQEISSCIASYQGVHEAITRVFKQDYREMLVSYYTAEREIPESELLAFAATFLPRYMIPSSIMYLEALPLSVNGKIDENRLPAPAAPEDEPDEPSNDRQSALLAIFREVLGRPEIGVSHDYFQCGGNSLNAMETIGKIAQAFGMTLRVADLYACRSARRLSELMEGYTGVTYEERAMTRAPAQERYPLTPIQQGIYVQSMLDPNGLAYNMAGAFRLGFLPDVAKLHAAFERVIADDRLFRTFFSTENDGIFARFSEKCEIDLPILNASGFEEAAGIFIKPFDLSCAPLIRAALWQEGEGSWMLFLDMHHIIGDGLSTPVLLRRIDEAYRGEAASDRLDFYDYLAYRQSGDSDTEPSQLDYWRENLAKLPEPLNLPGDFPRPHEFDYKGDSLTFTLSESVTTEVDEICAKAGITPFAMFLAAYGLLISRLAGKEDVVVGVPVADRSLPGTQDMCGPFLSTLPLRLRPNLNATVEEYLQAVRAAVAGMLDHQRISQEEIIAELKLPRSLTENPLYQTMFSLRPIDVEAFALDGNRIESIAIPSGTVKADLVIEAARERNAYTFTLEYASALFLPETAEYYGRCFEATICGMIANLDATLAEIDLLSYQDRERLIDIPNSTATPFVNIPLHRMIKKHANVDAPAITFRGKTTSRRELDWRACELANLLSAAGAGQGMNIGIAMRRGVDLIASILAALKIGGAYVPLLATLPEARLTYMLETAQIRFVICDRETLPSLPEVPGVTYVLTDKPASNKFQDAPVVDSDLINILFTSGSTGKPKGVMITHRGASNMQATMQDYLSLAKGPILCSTNIIFDAFVGETLCPLAMGKPIVMADEEEMMLPWKMAELISQHGVTTVQFTPARFQMCLTNDAFLKAIEKVRVIWFGGEVLTPDLLHKVSQATDAITVNMYGPTECTVYMTMVRVTDGERITIGRPIKNGRIYVLDEELRPVPPTACGELCLGGECLAPGYISRPDLTEAAFVPDPFFPGERMYRTGDIGRLRLDGCYDFMGRRDAQVKLNGQRVELDEITGAIMNTGFALQAATVPIRNEDGSMWLASFFVPASGGAAPSDIFEKLRSTLPVYMTPSQIIPVEKMPYTASDKIDVQTLIQMATERQSGEAPRGEPSKPEPAPVPSADKAGEPVLTTPTSVGELLAVWRESLKGVSELRGDLSFFAQGGTSLAALSVLSRYHNLGIIMSLAQFYANPSAEQQAELLGFARGNEAAPVAVPTGDAEQFPLPAKTPPVNSGASSLNTVLLTGATGFLGAHVFRSLLRAGAGKVFCLVRNGDAARLRDTLAGYFGSDWAELAIMRAEVIGGDISEPMLGMSRADYDKLASGLDAIWHCAADVRHYVGNRDEIFAANVSGTQAAIELARASGAALHHMSTASVAGDHLNGSDDTAVFTEDDFNIGQDWRENIYIQSKFLAEAAVFEAISSGIRARVYRLGRLVGRSSDGVFQKNRETNAFWLNLRAVNALGVLPASLAAAPVEMTPIDYCADAVVALRDAAISALHPLSPRLFTMEEASRAVSPSVAVVSDEEFERRISAGMDGDKDGVIVPLFDYWRRLCSAPPRIAVVYEKTLAELERAGFKTEISNPERFLSAFRFDN